MRSVKSQSPKKFSKIAEIFVLQIWIATERQVYLKTPWNLPQFKPTINSFKITWQNGSILFGSYVMGKNVDTGNLKISQRKSLILEIYYDQ